MPIMDIDKEGEPGDACPGLFGIPCPIVSPSLLGPKSAEEHADGHKRETHIHEIVKHVPDILVVAFGLDKKQIESHGKGCTKEGIAEHIDDDMGNQGLCKAGISVVLWISGLKRLTQMKTSARMVEKESIQRYRHRLQVMMPATGRKNEYQRRVSPMVRKGGRSRLIQRPQMKAKKRAIPSSVKVVVRVFFSRKE